MRKIAVLSYVSSDFRMVCCYAVAADKVESVRCDWASASATRTERELGYFTEGVLVMERWLIDAISQWGLNRAEAFDDRRSFEGWLRRNGLRGQPCVENALLDLPDPE
jgi:hypothetical protein